jgi:hypothetical protein
MYICFGRKCHCATFLLTLLCTIQPRWTSCSEKTIAPLYKGRKVSYIFFKLVIVVLYVLVCGLFYFFRLAYMLSFYGRNNSFKKIKDRGSCE